MRHARLAVVLWLLALIPASAAPPQRVVQLGAGNDLSWVHAYGPALDLDARNANRDGSHGRCYVAGSSKIYRLADCLKDSRAGVEYVPWADGHWSAIGAGLLPLTDLGLFGDAGIQRLGLWNSDLTNAAWVKANATIATVTGPDGVATSASEITATAANATVTQALTSASAARTLQLLIRRVAGSGEIDLTQDGGLTWTAITSANNVDPVLLTVKSLDGSWNNLAWLNATTTDPTIGIRLVVSGDVVDVWAFDVSSLALSRLQLPCVSTSAACNHGTDQITLGGPALGAILPGPPYTFFARQGAMEDYVAAHARAIVDVDDGSNNNLCGLLTNSAAKANIQSRIANVQTGNVASGVAVANGAVSYLAGACASADYAVSLNGGTVATASTAGTIASLSVGRLDVFPSNSNPIGLTPTLEIAVWNRRLTNGQFQGLQ